MTPVALTIAGSDPSGGAGLQADLKTFHQHGVYGMSVVTLLTVQNTQEVSGIRYLEPDWMEGQLSAVLSDISPQAAKTGALGTADMIAAVAAKAKEFFFPLIVDPVMISKHGDPLLDPSAVDVLKSELLPVAHLVTPNRHEAEQLSGVKIKDNVTMEQAARAIAELGPHSVLVKGGAFREEQIDLFWSDGDALLLKADRIQTDQTHGSGCVLSAAITARLALGDTLVSAVEEAKAFVTMAIETAPGLGHGRGPTNMHVEL